MSNIVWLLVFTGLLAAGQLLFKKVGLLMHGKPLQEAVWVVLASPTLYLSLALYALATGLWIWILSRMPLSAAYPWVGLGVVVVPLLATVLYGERTTPVFWAGAALVAAGIVLTQYGVRGPG